MALSATTVVVLPGLARLPLTASSAWSCGIAPDQALDYAALEQLVPAHLLTVDATTALASVTQPMLYLRGEYDRLVPERAVRHIVEKLPSVRVERVPAPHALLQTAPKAAWDAIVTLLR